MTMQMERMTLTGETRPTGVKRASNKTRRLGRIPGVVYGPGVDSFALSVDPKELESALLTNFGRNNVFNIAFDGATHSVMVKDTQFYPVRR